MYKILTWYRDIVANSNDTDDVAIKTKIAMRRNMEFRTFFEF